MATSGPEVASSELLPEISDNLIFLLSSVGSSERLLTARSLVRVQQGEPQKKERTSVLSFFVAPPVVLTDQSAKAELVRKFAKQT